MFSNSSLNQYHASTQKFASSFTDFPWSGDWSQNTDWVSPVKIIFKTVHIQFSSLLKMFTLKWPFCHKNFTNSTKNYLTTEPFLVSCLCRYWVNTRIYELITLLQHVFSLIWSQQHLQIEKILSTNVLIRLWDDALFLFLIDYKVHLQTSVMKLRITCLGWLKIHVLWLCIIHSTREHEIL